MNATTTANNTAKSSAPSAKPAKPANPQRRMARPAPTSAEPALSPTAAAPTAQRALAPASGSKTAAVIALLSRDGGATSAELISATGWLPHTMRAALTGLRKKGRTIERGKRGTETCYKITAALAQ